MQALSLVARSRSLLVFDYDGTLAPIARNPIRAPLPQSTRRLLRALTARYRCAVLSGRARSDVVRWLRGTGIRVVVGNHGMEWTRPSVDTRRVTRLVRQWRTALGERLASLRGVLLEDKRFSLSVHYRATRDPRRALSAIRSAIADLPELRVVPGKYVVNLVPTRAPHKGDAVKRLRRELAAERVLYTGDDVTDEDVFALRARWLVGIHVGPSRKSKAELFLPDQRAVDDLLRVLIAFRNEGGP